jgi:transcriptional regulator with XRE-family HTH domain
MSSMIHPLVTYLEVTGQTQAEFARALGVTRGYLTHIIKGRRTARLLIRRIAERTGIPLEKLRRAA